MKGNPAGELKYVEFGQGQSRNDKSCTMTIFCDLDGPIVDVSERYYTTYQMGLQEIQAIAHASEEILPINMLTKEQFWHLKRDRVPDTEIARESGLSEHYINLFLQRVRQIVNQPTLLEKDSLQPGVKWALALLHAQGARLVLVTLRLQSQATQILQDSSIAHLFSDIRGTQNHHAAYQNYAAVKTQLLSEVITEQSWPSGEMWMVGDTEADILAGQALGIPTIALTCGIRSYFYLKQFQPHRIEADLLSTANSLVNSTQLLPA